MLGTTGNIEVNECGPRLRESCDLVTEIIGVKWESISEAHRSSGSGGQRYPFFQEDVTEPGAEGQDSGMSEW